MPPLESPRPIFNPLRGVANPIHPSPVYTMLGLERMSVRELSYHGAQLGVDAPEIIVPMGWGEWWVINPGEPIPWDARVVGEVAP